MYSSLAYQAGFIPGCLSLEVQTCATIQLQIFFYSSENFLMLRPFSIVPYAVVTQTIKSLLPNCNFATVTNHNVNMCFLMAFHDPYEKLV